MKKKKAPSAEQARRYVEFRKLGANPKTANSLVFKYFNKKGKLKKKYK